MSDLRSAFVAFASFGSSKEESEIDNAKLSKLCKECGLIDKKFTTTDVDLIFNKVKAKGARKIPFVTFRDGFIPEAAARKGVEVSEIEAIVQKSAPGSSGTKADAVKFHDDKSQYTGVYAAGGPSTIDDKNTNMAGHMDRGKSSDARGVVTGGTGGTGGPTRKFSQAEEKEAPAHQPAPPKTDGKDASPNRPKGEEVSPARKESTSDAPSSRKESTSEAPPASSRKESTSESSAGDVRATFVAFASFGSSNEENEIDNAKLSKLCKECGLIDKKFTTTDVDLIFSKYKSGRKLSFTGFKEKFLVDAAKKKGVDVSVVEGKVAASAPTSSGTKADAVKFHDDKSQYTGVYAAGGPSTIDDKNTNMAGHMDRGKSSDARGVVTGGTGGTGGPTRKFSHAEEEAPARKESTSEAPDHQPAPPKTDGKDASPNRPKGEEVSPAPSSRKESTSEAPPAQSDSGVQEAHPDDVRATFVAFASFGSSNEENEIDNAKLSKLCKECGLIDKKFTTTDVDLIFSKYKSGRKLSFSAFLNNFIPDAAKKKGVDVGVVEGKIAASAPTSSGTKADAVKFHDDKSQYTGVYAAGGPSTIDNKNTDMAGHMDRGKTSDARGVVSGGTGGTGGPTRKFSHAEEGEAPARKESTSEAPPARKESTSEAPSASSRKESTSEAPAPARTSSNVHGGERRQSNTGGSVRGTFVAFASFGSSHEESDIDNAKLSKLCKETGLIDKKFTTTDVDLLFNKLKVKGSRKLSYGQFKDQFLPEVAKKKGVDVGAVEGQVAKSAPNSSGTKADAVKFHDDKSQYTGVYAAGGPSTIDDKNTNMAGHMDRDKKSDARGVVKQ